MNQSSTGTAESTGGGATTKPSYLRPFFVCGLATVPLRTRKRTSVPAGWDGTSAVNTPPPSSVMGVAVTASKPTTTSSTPPPGSGAVTVAVMSVGSPASIVPTVTAPIVGAAAAGRAGVATSAATATSTTPTIP